MGVWALWRSPPDTVVTIKGEANKYLMTKAKKKKKGTVPPYMVAAVICDVGVVDPSSGKKNLIGIFTRLGAVTFPSKRPMSLYVKMSDAAGEYPFKVELVRLNSDEIIATAEGKINAVSRTEYVDFLINFPPLIFSGPGRYEFRVLTSDMFVGSTFLDAVLIDGGSPKNQ